MLLTQQTNRSDMNGLNNLSDDALFPPEEECVAPKRQVQFTYLAPNDRSGQPGQDPLKWPQIGITAELLASQRLAKSVMVGAGKPNVLRQ